MSKYPTVDRESFQKFLASAFVVQQSQMDSQSRAALVDGLRKVDKTTGVAMGPLSGAKLRFLGLEEDDRSSGAVLSHLASMLAARGAGAVSTDTAPHPALNDIAEQARLIHVSCVVDGSTPPPRDEPPYAADSMDAYFPALQFRTPEVKTARLQCRDPWTPLLGIVAIALAFLLGWMLSQVTALGTTRQEEPPLRVTTGSDVAPAQPGVARQAEPSASPLIAPKSRSPETPSNSSRSQQLPTHHQ